MPDIEYEKTLIVVAASPESTLDQLKDLQEIAGLSVSTPKAQTQRDVYFDIGDGRLADRRIALRLRLSGTVKIGLKGPTFESQRTEIEGLWPNAIESVYRALEQFGVNHQRPVPDREHPVDAMKSTGLQIIHDRMNERTTLVLKTKKQEAGEIVLDRVTYQISGQEVYHFEIEVEAYNSEHIERVQEVSSVLLNTFKDQLLEADVGKLSLGLLLEQLQDEGMLRPCLTSCNTIRPDAYSGLLSRL